MVAHNYRAQGKKVLLIKPGIDTRFGSSNITSRAVQEMKADIIMEPAVCNLTDIDFTNVDCVLVDEAQFLCDINVNELRELTKYVPVICYGLRADYRSCLFPGSRRLFALADTIEEIKTVCVQCNKKAIINAKFCMQKEKRLIIREGSCEPDLGAEEKYQPMCWKCWSE